MIEILGAITLFIVGYMVLGLMWLGLCDLFRK